MPTSIDISLSAGTPSPVEIALNYAAAPVVNIELSTPATDVIEISFADIGPQGLSAYQVALANGFVGTEVEWLASLVGAGADEVTGEIPAGLINGSNATFTASFSFVPESVKVYINGMRQKLIDDYNTSGNTTILMAVSPETITNFLIDYQKL